MNGVHDLGGMHGFGAVPYAPEEPPFHAPWERRAFAMLVATAYPLGVTSDESRHAIERIGNERYLSTSYYEHWLIALEMILVEKGVLREEEVDARMEELRSRFVPSPHPVDGEDELARLVAESIRTGVSTLREIGQPPRFRVGDVVRTRVASPKGHTRLPRYARGKTGTIVGSHGAHVFPDANAHDLGERPEPLHTVRFAARELWGDDGRGDDVVHLDLWESYFE